MKVAVLSVFSDLDQHCKMVNKVSFLYYVMALINVSIEWFCSEKQVRISLQLPIQTKKQFYKMQLYVFQVNVLPLNPYVMFSHDYNYCNVI